jgi:hypothetical protein
MKKIASKKTLSLETTKIRTLQSAPLEAVRGGVRITCDDVCHPTQCTISPP